MNMNQVMFIVVTTMQIPSFLCMILILIRHTKRRSPLRRLHNHLLMYLLIVAIWTICIELPNTQKYLWTNSASFREYWFCSFWNTSYMSTATLNRILMAIMSIERHFLVFRPQFYRTRRSRLLFHYIPIFLIVSISLTYTFVTNLIVSCPQMRFNYSLYMCGYTCAALIRNLANIYTWASVFIPTLITVIGCILLPVRFIIQKRQLQQVDWHRTRKMIVQTSVIAGVYSLCWLPYTIILQLLSSNVLPFNNPDITRYLAITPYITSLLTPFITYHTVRRTTDLNMAQRLKYLLLCRRQILVVPAANFVAQQVNCGTANAHHSTRE